MRSVTSIITGIVRECRRGLEEYSHTLRLPEGYTIQPMERDPDERQLLVLKRADGSAVAAFEFSALGPGPRRIWEIAVEDAEAIADANEEN